jgi:hypothetical protein
MNPTVLLTHIWSENPLDENDVTHDHIRVQGPRHRYKQLLDISSIKAKQSLEYKRGTVQLKTQIPPKKQLGPDQRGHG